MLCYVNIGQKLGSMADGRALYEKVGTSCVKYGVVVDVLSQQLS